MQADCGSLQDIYEHLKKQDFNLDETMGGKYDCHPDLKRINYLLQLKKVVASGKDCGLKA